MRQIPWRNKLPQGKGFAPQFASALQQAHNRRLLKTPHFSPNRLSSPNGRTQPGSGTQIKLCLDCVTECLKVAQLSSRKMAVIMPFVCKLPISCANLVPNRCLKV
jgi:hypothetical protein